MDFSRFQKVSWFPGHMLKAERELREKLKQVDIVIQLVDARAPASTHNYRLQEIIEHKSKLLVMTKTDLADAKATEAWRRHYEATETPCFTIHHRQRQKLPRLVEALKETARADTRSRWGQLGYRRPLRAVVIGLPNVGKSSLINALVSRRRARTGPKPGVTRHQQWVLLGQDVELLDTPGIMVPNVGQPITGLRLGLLALIKNELLRQEDLVEYLLYECRQQGRTEAFAHYQVEALPESVHELLEQVGERLGFLQSGGRVDTDQAAGRIVHDFRTGELGNISLEHPDESSD